MIKIGTKNISASWMIAAICVVALLARIVLIHLRWINPDEGAHLMDGRFILQGLTPYVDYNARMPFYIYLIALFLKLFGLGFSAGRLLPVFCFCGRRLDDLPYCKKALE